MKRAVVALVGVVGLVLAAILLLGTTSPTTDPGPSSLGTASLDEVTRPARPTPPRIPPKAEFARTIYATSTLERSELMLDFCRGPIAIGLGDARPVLVAEHDFCGGSAWIPKLEVGQAITLKGDGVERGTYVVTVIEHQVRGKAKVSDLPATDVVLQTCVTPQMMVLVGVELFDPTVQS